MSGALTIKRPKLEINLVPQTAWFDNLRSRLKQNEWDFLRKLTYKNANYVCEVCGGRGDKHPVEAHEEWHYDDRNHIITLTKLVALCPKCHQCKHIGFSSMRGLYTSCLKHLSKVNDQTDEESKNQIEAAFEVWHYRNQFQWGLNLDNVYNFLKENFKEV